MNLFNRHKRSNWTLKGVTIWVALCFGASLLQPLPMVYAEPSPNLPASEVHLNLPPVGTRVSLSEDYAPVVVKGIRVFPENPLQFDFIVDTGDTFFKDEDLKKESNRLIKYFLASLTVPEDDLWVTH